MCFEFEVAFITYFTWYVESFVHCSGFKDLFEYAVRDKTRRLVVSSNTIERLRCDVVQLGRAFEIVFRRIFFCFMRRFAIVKRGFLAFCECTARTIWLVCWFVRAYCACIARQQYIVFWAIAKRMTVQL